MNSNPPETFAPSRLQEVIVLIIAESGRDLGATELAKLVYLVDVEAVRLTGRTITGQRYTRREKGPLAQDFGDAITAMDGFEISVSVGPKRDETHFPKHKHAAGKNPRFAPHLADAAVAIVRRVLQATGDLRPQALEKLAYGTEPMREICARETRAGHALLGEEVNLTLVAPNAALARWRGNKKQPHERDEKFEEFLSLERKEIDELIDSL